MKMAETTTTHELPDYPRGITFEEVRAALKKTERIVRRNDRRKIQGAIAGAIIGSEEKKAVLEAGLFVIEQSGDAMKIEAPQNFAPREF
jgi:hypothetical protein